MRLAHSTPRHKNTSQRDNHASATILGPAYIKLPFGLSHPDFETHLSVRMQR